MIKSKIIEEDKIIILFRYEIEIEKIMEIRKTIKGVVRQSYRKMSGKLVAAYSK
ncbi:hypothetical protein JQ031_06540 [Clostridium botulinum]|nr:hypothetical protein [Clostridium botulinum]